ncbi:MAG: tRNA dihydrouridine synthase DusB [Clostridia bacterium]|nr:tRNA dihydrouridine synthase DusB [Clostridia bacterium]
MDLKTLYGKECPLILAPLAGYTDPVYRTLCRRNGCDMAVTEMVSAKGLLFANENTLELLDTLPEERPVSAQLFGHEPEIMAEAVRRTAERMGDALCAIDINMGCPARKIVSNGDGSALLNDLPLAGRLMEAAVKASSVPVTVKMRLGPDETLFVAPELARIAEQSGVAAVAVHGRTRVQQYMGKADYGKIALVKQAVSIPVIGNGDVTDAESALKMLRETGCDGVMIGRGALGNPWIFREIRAVLDGEEPVPPTDAERAETALTHLCMAVEREGRRGLVELRKHLCHYFHGVRGAAQIRTKLQTAETPEETERILLDTFRT